MVIQEVGPQLAKKPLHLFWLLDVSGSMASYGKIDALNDAMRAAVPAVRSATEENPGVEVLVRAVTFAHDAEWHVAEPVPIEGFTWTDVAAVERGTTELGRAIALVTEAIRDVARTRRGLPPAIVLVSDGKPTDYKQPSYGAGMRELLAHPWGAKSSRMAIGIGKDADLPALQRFIGHEEVQPLLAKNAAELQHYIRWASTVVVDHLSRSGGEWLVDYSEEEHHPTGPTEPDAVVTGPTGPTEPDAVVTGPTGPTEPDAEATEPTAPADQAIVSIPTELSDTTPADEVGAASSDAEMSATPVLMPEPEPGSDSDGILPPPTGPAADLPPPAAFRPPPPPEAPDNSEQW